MNVEKSKVAAAGYLILICYSWRLLSFCDVSCRDLLRVFRDLDLIGGVQVDYTLSHVINTNLQRIKL